MGRCSSKPCCDISDVTTLSENRLISVQPIVDEKLAPTPPTLRRDDIISDISMFKKVDSYAAKVSWLWQLHCKNKSLFPHHVTTISGFSSQAPKSTELSLQNLSRYLSKASKSNLGRVRAFYYWICHHVE